MKKLLFFIPLLATTFFGCNTTNTTSNNEKENLQQISLRQEWSLSVSYLGEIVAINETDSINGLDINLIEGADDIDPIKMVLSGSDKFGVSGADRVFAANEVGADLVVIGVVNYINPTCFIALEELNVHTPKDFEGKKIGVFTGNNTEMIYRTLVKKAELDKSKLNEIEASFDLISFQNKVYEIRPAYIFDEPVSLDQQNIKYTVVKPQDYDVSFVGPVYFTTQNIIKNEPELVQKFINSIAQGWEIALENPEKALKYLTVYSKNADINRERLSFKVGIDYFRGENGKVLTSDILKWKQMGNDLKDLGIIKTANVDKFINNSFIEKYHNKK
jgi:NitT/TauT family transport system substrate-binding protein